MKIIKLITILVLISNNSYAANLLSKNLQENTLQNREFYQLKTYVLETEEQMQSTDNYLKNAYLPALKKMGIKEIGVFKTNLTLTDTIKKIVVLIPFSSLQQLASLETTLAKDKTYLAAATQYLNASYKKPAYSRIESVILQAFADHPFLTKSTLDTPRATRIYELRSYESPTETYYKSKVDMFNAGGEIELFSQLNFNAVFYGEVLSGNHMPNLMYMTTFDNQKSRDDHWKAFVDSSTWKTISAMEKYKNTISHMDIVFMHPTEYSDY